MVMFHCLSRTWGQPLWDAQRYIDIDEIQPGMEAVCRTCYSGTTVEEFPLAVVSVVHDIEPGHDAILVQGLDDRFQHTGPVAGCSGSPVYIQGRMAGALAFGWPYSKDPLYGVTPIRSMLEIQEQADETSRTQLSISPFRWNPTAPLDVQAIAASYQETVQAYKMPRQNTMGLCISGIPNAGQETIKEDLAPFGLIPLTGGGGGAVSDPPQTTLTPGASLVIPLMEGDIQLAAIGTATEVRDGRVFAFGHSFLGYGTVDLPMATGYVHTIVSNLSRSFKLASPLASMGALTYDCPVGIMGQIGRQARMIDLNLTLDHYMKPGPCHYRCRMTANELLGPTLLQTAVEGMMEGLGGYPPDHVLDYDVQVAIQDHAPLHFANISVDMGLNELMNEVLSVMLLLQSNPYRSMQIDSIDLQARLSPLRKQAYLAGVEVDYKSVRPGQTINVKVTLEGHQGGRSQTEFSVQVPDDAVAGQRLLTVCGPYEYMQFVRQTAPQRFTALDGDSLIRVLNDVLNISRSQLYCVFLQPSSGLVVESRELPGLPASRAVVLQNSLKSVTVSPYHPWLEQTRRIDQIVAGRQSVRIEVVH